MWRGLAVRRFLLRFLGGRGMGFSSGLAGGGTRSGRVNVRWSFSYWRAVKLQSVNVRYFL